MARLGRSQPFGPIIKRRLRGIDFDAASNSGYQAAQSTYTWSHTNNGDWLSVDVAMFSLAQTVTSITYAGVSLDLEGFKASVSGACRIECWGMVAPAMGANNIIVTLSGSIASGAAAVSYKGVQQFSPTEAFNTAQATNVGAADATVNITSVTDNCWIHAALCTDDGSVTSNNTSRNNITGGLGTGADSDNNTPKMPAGSVTMSWTNVGAVQTWSIAGYALRPAGTANIASIIFRKTLSMLGTRVGTRQLQGT